MNSKTFHFNFCFFYVQLDEVKLLVFVTSTILFWPLWSCSSMTNRFVWVVLFDLTFFPSCSDIMLVCSTSTLTFTTVMVCKKRFIAPIVWWLFLITNTATTFFPVRLCCFGSLFERWFLWCRHRRFGRNWRWSGRKLFSQHSVERRHWRRRLLQPV